MRIYSLHIYRIILPFVAFLYSLTTVGCSDKAALESVEQVLATAEEQIYERPDSSLTLLIQLAMDNKYDDLYLSCIEHLAILYEYKNDTNALKELLNNVDNINFVYGAGTTTESKKKWCDRSCI